MFFLKLWEMANNMKTHVCPLLNFDKVKGMLIPALLA